MSARPGSPLVTRTQALELASLGQADTVACSASQEGGLRWVDVVTSLSTLSTLSTYIFIYIFFLYYNIYSIYTIYSDTRSLNLSHLRSPGPREGGVLGWVAWHRGTHHLGDLVITAGMIAVSLLGGC